MRTPSSLRSAVLFIATLLAGCTAAAEPPATTPPSLSAAPRVSAAPSPSVAAAVPSLVPPAGRTWFGMNLDWGHDSVAAVGERLGETPMVWVQFVRFPLDEAAVANLAGFFEQVGAAGGVGLVTLEPHDGLSAATPAAAADLVDVLAGAWEDHGVATLVRFAHEMNGSWYPWGQQPAAYVDAFRTVAEAVHDAAPASAMVWAPNEGAGYPFSGGAFEAAPGSAERTALDTDGDGDLTRADDPYSPYWPGDDAVDWVGMSLYFWGLEYPWGENEIAPPTRFADALRGRPSRAHADEVAVPDFYDIYADGHDMPMAIIETAALYDPAGVGPTEAEVKGAWFRQVFGEATRDEFPRIGLLSWFEWAKDEPEVGGRIDWRLTGDSQLGRELLGTVPEDWLLFAGE